jgi:hypothetical protein
MKCARCNRELSRPALTIGSQSIGPKCAELMGLTNQRVLTIRAPLVQHDQQKELFDADDIRQQREPVETRGTR